MLGITADVNGRVVGRIFIQNVDDLDTGACLYSAAVGREDGDWLVGVEDVVHRREAGWGALVSKVLQRPGVTLFLRLNGTSSATRTGGDEVE